MRHEWSVIDDGFGGRDAAVVVGRHFDVDTIPRPGTAQTLHIDIFDLDGFFCGIYNLFNGRLMTGQVLVEPFDVGPQCRFQFLGPFGQCGRAGVVP